MKVVLKCVPKLFKNGYLLLPATKTDKQILNSICETIGNGAATVTVNHSKSLKSYDQCKTVFALITLYFYIRKERYPTEGEKALVYSKLLWEYAPKTENPLNPDEYIPIPLSEMTKQQAAIFINCIMAEIYEFKNGLTDYQEIELKELFEEFYSHNGYGYINPIDYDEDGNILSEAEWRAKNNFSFASGIEGTEATPLHLHHIISRGARKDLIMDPTNWIMLTAEEHMYYHENGWDKFLSLYPNCALRVKHDFESHKHPMPFDLQKALIKLNLLDSLIDYEEEND